MYTDIFITKLFIIQIFLSMAFTKYQRWGIVLLMSVAKSPNFTFEKALNKKNVYDAGNCQGIGRWAPRLHSPWRMPPTFLSIFPGNCEVYWFSFVVDNSGVTISCFDGGQCWIHQRRATHSVGGTMFGSWGCVGRCACKWEYVGSRLSGRYNKVLILVAENGDGTRADNHFVMRNECFLVRQAV